MNELNYEQLELVNGGGHSAASKDMAWGAITGACSGALELSGFGVPGAIAGAMIGGATGAFGGVGVHFLRDKIGLGC